MDYIEIAKKYSKAGYSVIPVTSEKIPAIRDWSGFQSRPMTEKECEKNFKNCWGIALLCGGQMKVSAGDFDLKYDLSGDIFERFKKKLPVALLNKFYVQTTKNNGFHVLFTCDKVEPNQKLASRYTTCYEKHETYMKAFHDPNTRDKAIKIASNDKTRVLMETRGGSDKVAGGYVVMAPSPDYKHVFGKINKISVEEYDLIMDTAREFNDVVEVKTDIKVREYRDWKLSPFEDYNDRGDVLEVLLANGWEEINARNGSVRLKRAGHTHSKSSALFDTETRIFNCFSTSTSFDVNKGYTPTDVLSELEFDNDMSKTFKYLTSEGFGEQ